MRVDALPQQGIKHSMAASERDRALSRAPTQQNGYFSEILVPHHVAHPRQKKEGYLEFSTIRRSLQ